ncbi:MAG: murein L,D-transpeptidase, partial [Sulfurovum sp.]
MRTIKTYKLIAILLFAIIMPRMTIASELEYQEVASEIIMNSLQEQQKNGFLKKMYRQLFFVPVWMHEKGLSVAANDLFAQIQEDGTLDPNGKLSKDAILLQNEAKKIYTNNGSITQKIDLEFKISQLYEAYTN